jgi:hypothetical protein
MPRKADVDLLAIGKTADLELALHLAWVGMYKSDVADLNDYRKRVLELLIPGSFSKREFNKQTYERVEAVERKVSRRQSKVVSVLGDKHKKKQAARIKIRNWVKSKFKDFNVDALLESQIIDEVDWTISPIDINGDETRDSWLPLRIAFSNGHRVLCHFLRYYRYNHTGEVPNGPSVGIVNVFLHRRGTNRWVMQPSSYDVHELYYSNGQKQG